MSAGIPKYAFSEIYEYLAHKTYPVHADKLYKHDLRKRSKFFVPEGGRLFYIGGEKRTRSLVWWWRVRTREGEY